MTPPSVCVQHVGGGGAPGRSFQRGWAAPGKQVSEARSGLPASFILCSSAPHKASRTQAHFLPKKYLRMFLIFCFDILGSSPWYCHQSRQLDKVTVTSAHPAGGPGGTSKIRLAARKQILPTLVMQLNRSLRWAGANEARPLPLQLWEGHRSAQIPG
jgi:hypothetical protein